MMPKKMKIFFGCILAGCAIYFVVAIGDLIVGHSQKTPYVYGIDEKVVVMNKFAGYVKRREVHQQRNVYVVQYMAADGSHFDYFDEYMLTKSNPE